MIVGLFVVLIGAVSFKYIHILYKDSIKLKEIEYNRHLMATKADELRHSSNDLTRFAKSYVITGDKKYKENYFEVLSIRNGLTPRPKDYEAIYWDLSEPIRKKRHPYEKKISLEDEMKELPYSKSEYSMITESEDNSNDLLNLEVEAFHTMEGDYKDGEGVYNLHKDTNQTKAIALLHSKNYNMAKEKSMLPIDKLLLGLQERSEAEIAMYIAQIESSFEKLFYILGLGFLLFLITVYTVYKKIFVPIDYLTKSMRAYNSHEKELEEKIFYDDEIGFMSRQFYEMKKRLDEDYRKIKRLALHDPLTGVANRNLFFNIADEVVTIAKRDNLPLSLLMIDIDFFKKVNDTYGHLIGDAILKHTSKLIQKSLRESDVVARFGGEEFIVLLPHTGIEGAKSSAEKIRKQVATTPYIDATHEISVSVSIGVATFKRNSTIEEMIQEADEALYRAKEGGRNRVEV